MSVYIASLNSGSNGNCYYIGNSTEAVLVDAGISCKETEKRMKRLGLSFDKIKAIFVSHEHSDHIKGLSVLSRKYQIPVYITPGTCKNSKLILDEHLCLPFRAFEKISIGGLVITPFPKFHDAADPHSFLVENDGIRVGVFTDIGNACENLISHFKQCHAAFLEANYCEQMLDQGSYPYHLKRRIRGGHGHLSNKQALELFVNHKPDFMTCLLLAHLSRDNNCPDLVNSLFSQYAENTRIVVASRYEESPLFEITSHSDKILKSRAAPEQFQLSLF